MDAVFLEPFEAGGVEVVEEEGEGPVGDDWGCEGEEVIGEVVD